MAGGLTSQPVMPRLRLRMHSRSQPGRKVLGASVVLGLLLSQPGHALGYLARYGPSSFAIESQGVHAYFPSTIHLSLGLLATLALVVAGLLGFGRLALGKALGLRRTSTPSPTEIILVLLVVQVNVFAFQELAEAASGGAALNGAWLFNLALFALAGQVPVAVIAGLLIAWCSVHLEASLNGLRESWRLPVLAPKPVVAAAQAAPRPVRASALAETFPQALAKRGPPLVIALSYS